MIDPRSAKGRATAAFLLPSLSSRDPSTRINKYVSIIIVFLIMMSILLFDALISPTSCNTIEDDVEVAETKLSLFNNLILLEI